MLLIIDNAPCHPSCKLLDRENGLFRVVFLPSNPSLLIQPIDQTIIQTESTEILFKRGTRCQDLLCASRNKLLGYHEDCVNQSTGCDDYCTAVIEMFKKFKLSRAEVEQWLADNDTPLFEILTDDEILRAMKKMKITMSMCLISQMKGRAIQKPIPALQSA
ncbi:hypothetical protein T10_8142 [Trichinella papuae]|uniref:DDE-1 domain-containing protein n=1 Tax=Trichinella papuae TaxID=268474 RepID=A0A0V1MMT1_9BILA|nr:hypothetical protein T10_8142 [Trichinella papuae]